MDQTSTGTYLSVSNFQKISANVLVSLPFINSYHYSASPHFQPPSQNKFVFLCRGSPCESCTLQRAIDRVRLMPFDQVGCTPLNSVPPRWFLPCPLQSFLRDTDSQQVRVDVATQHRHHHPCDGLTRTYIVHDLQLSRQFRSTRSRRAHVLDVPFCSTGDRLFSRHGPLTSVRRPVFGWCTICLLSRCGCSLRCALSRFTLVSNSHLAPTLSASSLRRPLSILSIAVAGFLLSISRVGPSCNLWLEMASTGCSPTPAPAASLLTPGASLCARHSRRLAPSKRDVIFMQEHSYPAHPPTHSPAPEGRRSAVRSRRSRGVERPNS